MNSKTQLIEELFNHDLLISPEILNADLALVPVEKLTSCHDLAVLNSENLKQVLKDSETANWYDLDRQQVDLEKENRNNNYFDDSLFDLDNPVPPVAAVSAATIILSPSDQKFGSALSSELDSEDEVQSSETRPSEMKLNPTTFSITSATNTTSSIESFSNPVTVLSNHKSSGKKYTVKDFSQIFLARYQFLERLLSSRQGLQSTLAINRLLNKKEKENISVIGLVVEINETKSGNLMLALEDPTGTIKVLISKSKAELFSEAKDLVPDEVIALNGLYNDGIIFADQIFWPEIPYAEELKKSEEEEYAVFLSDLHVGSKQFLGEAFDKFLRWINGRAGHEEQRAVAEKVKYIFIAGDLVDGVGVYPSQEDDLELKNLTDQYNEFVQLIKQIPGDKKIIVSPGNHDGVHLAEPQPLFYEHFAPEMFKLPNLILVNNPALIKIGQTATFSGFKVLLYHGFSFDYYVANVASIREGGGYHRADLIMKFLLRRRHLAPSFTSTPYRPGFQDDPLLIKEVPDFFLSGHIHYSKVANYRGTTLVCGSCWQGKTSYQEKLGHEPEPGRVPLVNLKTREVKVLKFI